MLVLIDFSNAFSLVDYDILIILFCNANALDSALEWFSSYLQRHSLSFRVGQSNSDDVKDGLPQDDIILPSLLSIYQFHYIVKTSR